MVIRKLRVNKRFIIIMVAMVGLLMRIGSNPIHRVPTHDEGISILAATAHQEEYARAQVGDYPANQVVQAKVWQDFLRIDKIFPILEIRQELLQRDVHPPLFFWFLHVWFVLVGSGVGQGILLNWLLVPIIIVTLYRYARWAIRNELLVYAIIFIWAVSPSAIEASFQVRQYSLLLITTIVFAWASSKLVTPDTRPTFLEYIALFLASVFGLLTHYIFFAVIVAGIVLVVYHFLRFRSNDMGRALITILLSLIVIIPIQSRFIEQFAGIQNNQALSISIPLLMEHLDRIVIALLGFLFPGRVLFASWERWQLATGLLFHFAFWSGLLLLLWWINKMGNFKDLLHQTRFLSTFVFLSITSLVVFGLYLLNLTPLHAMDAQYLVVIQPFVLVTAAILLLGISRRRNIVVGFFCSMLALSGLSDVVITRYLFDRQIDPTPILSDADLVMIDSLRRGTLLRVIGYVPQYTKVVAATQDYFLATDLEKILQGANRIVYISLDGYENTPETTNEILENLAKQYEIRSDDGQFRPGSIYTISTSND